MSFRSAYEVRFWGIHPETKEVVVNHLASDQFERNDLDRAVKFAKNISLEEGCNFVAVTDINGKHNFGPLYFENGIQTKEHPEVLRQGKNNIWIALNDCQISNLTTNLMDRESTEYARKVDFENMYEILFEDPYPLYQDFVAVASVMLMVFDKNHLNSTEQDYKKFLFALRVFFDDLAIKRIEKQLTNN